MVDKYAPRKTDVFDVDVEKYLGPASGNHK